MPSAAIPYYTCMAASEHPFQVFPPASADEIEALREEIRKRGIVDPVSVDQHGRILDGHTRVAIAESLGIEYPTQVYNVASDEEARDLAFALNLRRNPTLPQKRTLAIDEINRSRGRKDGTDRRIGVRVGLDHKTIGAIRHALADGVPLDDITAGRRTIGLPPTFEPPQLPDHGHEVGNFPTSERIAEIIRLEREADQAQAEADWVRAQAQEPEAEVEEKLHPVLARLLDLDARIDGLARQIPATEWDDDTWLMCLRRIEHLIEILDSIMGLRP
jgi:ParB-like chromosome segregation protein Spo0J